MIEPRLALVARELRRLEVDVVGLQEASAGRRRGSVAARLAAALGFHHVFAPATERVLPLGLLNRLVVTALDFNEGPAVLSRFPIAAAEVFDLPRCGRPFNVRVLLRAEVVTPWGPVQAFSTHTAGDPCQAARVHALVREHRGPWPAVVMGDFNAREGSPAITALTGGTWIDAFRRVNREAPGHTVWQRMEVATPTVSRRVDYVFLAPGTRFVGDVRASRVVLDTPARTAGQTLWLSDHYGVLADVELFR